MTVRAFPADGPLRSRRISLPAGLLVVGIALSSSTACLTTPDVARAQREAETQRVQITAALAPAFPAKAGYTIYVYGMQAHLGITATGKFTPQAADAFIAAVRALYDQKVVSDQTRITVSVYHQDATSRQLVTQVQIAPPRK
jgi:hypothetical protein